MVQVTTSMSRGVGRGPSYYLKHALTVMGIGIIAVSLNRLLLASNCNNPASTDELKQHLRQHYASSSSSHTNDNNNPPHAREPKLADGCYHIYLDVGANIGVHTRFLFEPTKYPNAKHAHSIFNDEFNATRDNRDLCAFGFEPNPNHAKRHEALIEAYKAMGWRYHYIPAAVSNEGGNMTFYHNHDEKNEEWGFSDHDLKGGGKAGEEVVVPKIRLANWLMEEVYHRQLPDKVYGIYDKGPRVVMKMDIESQEYAVLPDVMFSGSLCKTVHTIFGEYHPWAIEYDEDPRTGRGGLSIPRGEGPGKIKDFVSFFHSFKDCELNTKFVELDDESYLHDGVPFPNATR
jgi:hypothetical protein